MINQYSPGKDFDIYILNAQQLSAIFLLFKKNITALKKALNNQKLF
jgi:hypothetical protein